MMLRRKLVLTFAAGTILAVATLAGAQAQPTSTVKTGYAPVNGLNLIMKIHGSGEPMILLAWRAGLDRNVRRRSCLCLRSPDG